MKTMHMKLALVLMLANISNADEFNQPEALDDWARVYEQEGYANQLEGLRVTSDGYLEMIPHTTTWYMEHKGPLVYQEVTGDFVFTTDVRVSNRSGDGYPSSIYSLAGIMVREPQPAVSNSEHWQAQQENYVFISAGRTGNLGVVEENVIAPHIEVKTTVNSQSQLEVTPINATQNVELRIVRSGDYIITLFRTANSSWQVARRLNRGDLPPTVQVGMMAYSDYGKVSSYDARFQIFNVLNENLTVDPSSNSNLPFNADVVALFDYARVLPWVSPSEWANVDLTSGALGDQDIIDALDSIVVDSDQFVDDDQSQIPVEPEVENEPDNVADSACEKPWPLTQEQSIVAVGNSFIGNYGGVCQHLSALEESSPLEFSVAMECDFRYGAYLREMFSDPGDVPDLNVVADAQSGNYDYGLFISDILGDDISQEQGVKGMIAFDQLYDLNCMQSIVFMTWNFANPVGNQVESLEDYRQQILELAQRMRYMEQERSAKVVPYGVVLYNLTMNPPAELSHMPLDYIYEPNGNIHDNALGVWLKANTLYASLYHQNPAGLNYQGWAFQGDRINTPATQGLPFSAVVQRQLQDRIWEIVQQWNNGIALEELLVPAVQSQHSDDRSQQDDIVTYQLQVSGGTGSGVYAEGETVVITADPAPSGQQFSHWQGDVSGVMDTLAATTQLTMSTSDLALYPVYESLNVEQVGDYRYLRFEITGIGGNNQWHFRELEWIDSQGHRIVEPLTSNQAESVQLTTSYPTNFAYRAFDGNPDSNYYINTTNENSNLLPIQFTLQLDGTTQPAGIRVHYPMWSPNLTGFRCLISRDGSEWEVLQEYSDINVNQFVHHPGPINMAEFRW